mgnify:CR=1
MKQIAMCIESGDLPCCSSLSYQKPKRSHSQLTEYICMASTISDTTYYDGDEYDDVKVFHWYKNT